MASNAGPELWSIEHFIPHRGAMRLIDRVLGADDQEAWVEATLRADNVFMQQHNIPSYVAAELMAQAVAAWAGVRAWRQNQKPPKGFLMGIPSLSAHVAQFAVGTVLRVHVRCAFGQQQARSLFDGTIWHGEACVVTARLAVCRALEHEQSTEISSTAEHGPMCTGAT